MLVCLTWSFLCPASSFAMYVSEIEVNYCLSLSRGLRYGPGIQGGIKGDTVYGYTYPKTGLYLFLLKDYENRREGTDCGEGGYDYLLRSFCNGDNPPDMFYLTTYYNPLEPWRLVGSTPTFEYSWISSVCATSNYHRVTTFTDSYYVYYQGKLCGAQIDHVPNLVSQLRSEKYDSTDKTIANKGCAMASLTMLMNSEKCNTGLLEVNGCKDCFVGTGGFVNWNNTLSKFCNSTSYISDAKDVRKSVSYKEFLSQEEWEESIENGYKYILRVRGSSGDCGHFVFLTGLSDDCDSMGVLDPSGRVNSVSKICGYRKFK